jgi:high affinity Mn2+ porin
MRARSVLAVAALGMIAAPPTFAAPAKEPGSAELLAEIRRLAARVEELERKRPVSTETEQRIQKLEQHNAAVEKALDEDTISDSEPQVAARLKATETDVLSYKKGKKLLDALGDVKVGAGMTMVGQNMVGQQLDKEGQLNWRGDVTVTLPGGKIGESKGTIFTHVRMGQGRGVQAVNNSFSSPNATAFQRPGADNSDAAIDLVQAWYQLDTPVPFGVTGRMEFTLGKMDPFVFFDQNTVAADETRYFMNQALVHNPLLDAGGDVGVDGLGFTPGLRVAYVNESDKSMVWRLQAAVLETGDGAAFQNSTDFPFRIVQAETTQRFFGGLDGNYRVYAWMNDRAANFDTKRARHAGIGLSMDQKVDDYVTLFARYGYELKGNPRFDQSLSLGGEIGGSYWGRGTDGLGLAMVVSHTSKAFRDKSETLDNDNDGNPDFGYKAQSLEQLAEIYYRYRLLPNFELTPDFQMIRHPGGDPSSAVAYALGLRGQLTY